MRSSMLRYFLTIFLLFSLTSCDYMTGKLLRMTDAHSYMQ